MIDYDKLSDEQLKIASKIQKTAKQFDVDPEYALALAYQENRFRTATSPKGALGPMQVMPNTAKELNIDPNNIDQNIMGGIKYLKQNLMKYDNDKLMAAIAYNAGPNHAFFKERNYDLLPDETLKYARDINKIYSLTGAKPVEETVEEPSAPPPAAPPAAAAPAAPVAPEPKKPFNVEDLPAVDIMGNPTDATLAGVGAPVMSGAVGALKPLAGVAQFAGINAPARKLEELTGSLNQIGGTASKVADITGQVLSPIPTKILGAAQKLPMVGEIGSKIAQVAPKAVDYLSKSALARGAGQGTLAAAFNPVNLPENMSYSDFLREKVKDLSAGAGIGALTGKASQLVLNPAVGAKIQQLKDMGIKSFTPGQLMSEIPVIGKGAQKFEQSLTSMPISGMLIQQELANVNKNMNVAMANRALKPLGETVPKDIQAGPELMQFLQNKANTSYDKIADKINFAPKPTTLTNLNKVVQDAGKNLTRKENEEFVNTVKDKFYDPLLTGNYSLNGQQFRSIESSLGTMAYRLQSSADASQRALGHALSDFQSGLRRELADLNPAHAKELQGIHNFYKQYLRLQRAAGMRGSVENVFSPAQLSSATHAMASKGQRATTSGISQKEAQMIEDVLGKNIPDSGTAGRLASMLTAKGMLGGLGEGLGHLASFGAPAIATGALYNPLSRKIMTKVATERPDVVRAVEPEISGALSRAASIKATQ